MKTLSIIPLLLLSACSTPNAPTLTIRPQEPRFPIDAPGIRYPELIGAYHLGRYVDPSNALHEQHTVYRVEAGGRWDFHPGPREAEVGPPPFERDAAFSVPPATDEIIAELKRRERHGTAARAVDKQRDIGMTTRFSDMSQLSTAELARMAQDAPIISQQADSLLGAPHHLRVIRAR